MAVWWKRWILKLVFIILMILAVILLIYGPKRLAVIGLTIENSIGIAVVLRIDMWSRALAMIRDMPWTDIGLNTFPLAQTQFYPGFLLGPEPHAHNLFIQTTLDLGISGLLAFLWLIIAFSLTALYAYLKISRRDLQLVPVGLCAGVLAFVAGGILDTMTLGAKSVPVLWVMFGMVGAIVLGEHIGDADKAKALLKMGQDNGASPSELLDYYLNTYRTFAQ